MPRTKVSIIGAGMVGSAVAYTLMQSGLFQEIVIIDVNKDKAEGETLDIIHGAAFVKPLSVVSGDYNATSNSDIVIITAGASQKPGESRLDLMERNVVIFKDIVGNAINKSPNAVFLVVSNPVDILSYITYKIANIESNRVIGSGTVLDSSRLRYHLGQILEVDPRNVHAYIVGEHGDSEFAHWSTAFVGALSLNDYAKNRLINLDDIKNKVENDVRMSAQNIISKKGYTNYAIAMSVKRICEAIIRNERSILSISQYDPKNDIYYSIPCLVGSRGKIAHIKPSFNKDEMDKLNQTIKVIKDFTRRLSL